MSAELTKVLIVDDDPSHIEIHGQLVQSAGLAPIGALVHFAGVDIPSDEQIQIVLLDYRLRSLKSSSDIAREIHALYPLAPIVVLSDLWRLPADIAPFVTEFVRKGEPARLLDTICRLVPCPDPRPARTAD